MTISVQNAGESNPLWILGVGGLELKIYICEQHRISCVQLQSSFSFLLPLRLGPFHIAQKVLENESKKFA